MPKEATIDKSGLTPEVLSFIESLEGERDQLATALGEATDLLEKAHNESDPDDEEGDDEDELLKSADPKLVALVKSAQAEAKAANAAAAKAEEIAKAERDVRVVAEHVSKASSLNIGSDNAKLGLALKDIVEKCGKETYETVWGTLTAASEAITKSGLLKEKGSSLSSDINDGPTAEITKRAEAMIANGTAKTMPEAIAKTVAADPSLYSEHVQNVRKGA